MNIRLLVALLVVGFSPLSGAYLYKNGHLINQKDVATSSVEQHYQRGIEALKAKKWEEAYQQFHIVVVNFADTSLAQESQYYLGVTLYEMNDLEEANDALTAFLQRNNAPTHIEDVYRYKLSIAQKIADGAACHLFGWHSMPKLQTGRSIALEIFDEIASGLPNHDIAASALLRKAALQRYLEEFAPAVEVYQTAIRRFPGSSFALTAYQEIAATYVEEMRRQPHNVDALTLAEINLKEIKRAFPQAKEVAVVDNQVKAVKELYVTALYETGQLFERMSEPKASVLYYHLALTAFPTSSVAEPCRERLKALSAYAEELHVPPQSTL